MEKVLEDTDYIPMIRIGFDIAPHIQDRTEYEGDIIQGIYYSPFDSEKENNGKDFHCLYTHDKYYPAYSIEFPWGATTTIDFDEASLCKMQVVGNIFENIELLSKIELYQYGRLNKDSLLGTWLGRLLKQLLRSDRLKKLQSSSWAAEVLLLYGNIL